MRKKIIAANWKMNLNYAEAMALADELVDSTDDLGQCGIIIAAPFVYLHDLVGRIQSHPYFSVAAQNISDQEKGAFTGEISASMLVSIGVEHVIIGHSERRTIFGENDAHIQKKISTALKHGLMPVFCCGEQLASREKGDYFKIVEAQLQNGLFHVEKFLLQECLIAYEPVWAIGTGVNANASQVQEMHAFIRSKVAEKYGKDMADQISILYGGSLTSKNSEELFNCPDVDGGLVGGASLKATEFLAIIESMNNSKVRA